MNSIALALVFLLASPSQGAKDEASGLSGYQFDKPLQCGKHLLPPSVCFPDSAYALLDNEVKRLQAVEKNAQAAGDRRLTFFIGGAILGIALGIALGGTFAWILTR